MEDELKEDILRLLKSCKAKCRYYRKESNGNQDILYLGIEATKSTNPKLYNKLKSIKGMTPVNIVFGRWVFKVSL